MNVAVVCEEALLVRVVEVGAVVDGGLIRGGAAEDFGAPCVAGERGGLVTEFSLRCTGR